MPDTGTQIRDYYDEIVIRVDVDEVLEPAHSITPLAPRRFPGAVVAGLAAAAVLLIVGSLGLWLATSQPSVEPATPATSEPPTTVPPPTLPEVVLADVPAFEATIRYELGGRGGTLEESTVDVLFSYEPPDSYRREILAIDPPDTEFWRGAVGDVVESDGTFPVVTGETTEEGGVLNALVWPNWVDRCSSPPVASATPPTVGTFTTVTCDDPEDPWTIVVDRDSGLVVQATAELHGDDFTIPGIGLEMIGVTYEPDFAQDWFASLEPEPPSTGEPIVFTYTESLLVNELTGVIATDVVTITWLEPGTWRHDVASGATGPGSFHIYADQTWFTYLAGSNEYLEERFPVMEAPGLRSECDQDGICAHDDIELLCETAPDGLIAGRAVTRHECNWPAPYTPSTLWVDNELGFVLKSVEGVNVFEVIEIELDPVVDPTVFDQVCPTADCTLVDSS